MEVALAGDFMAAADHFGDHLRLMLADPAEHEEGRLGADLVEQIESGSVLR